jgi:hypothetical protein
VKNLFSSDEEGKKTEWKRMKYVEEVVGKLQNSARMCDSPSRTVSKAVRDTV